MGQEPTIICEWRRPKEFAEQAADQWIKRGKVAVPRVILTTAALLAAFYWYINKILPDLKVSFGKAFLFVFAYASVGIFTLFFVAAFFMRRSRTHYRITDEGVRILGGDKSRLYRWKNLESFAISDVTEPIATKVVTLYTTDGRCKSLPLPPTEESQSIIHALGDKLVVHRELDESGKAVRISASQWTFLVVFAVAYYILAVYVFVVRLIPEDLRALVLPFSMICGPGTIGLFILFGRKAWKDRHLFANAIVFNMLSVLLVMMFIMLFGFYYYSQQLQ